MVLCKDTLKKIFGDKYNDNDYTPNGIDLRLKGVQICLDNPNLEYGFNIDGSKILPEIEDLEMDENGYYHFIPGKRYLWNLGVNEYPNMIGTYYLRSTIMRGGGKLYSSVADLGYNGSIFVGFETSNNIKIPFNERVVQCIYSELDDNTGEQYNGDYQKDKIYKEKI